MDKAIYNPSDPIAQNVIDGLGAAQAARVRSDKATVNDLYRLMSAHANEVRAPYGNSTMRKLHLGCMADLRDLIDQRAPECRVCNKVIDEGELCDSCGQFGT